MSRRAWLFVLLSAVTGVLLVTSGARGDASQTFYSDGFEGYAVGEHPAVWSEIWGDASDVVTDEWAASGTKSFVTVSPSGGWVKRPIIHLGDIGAWPLPEHFFYECTLHMEATSCSNGFVGFMFKDPRYANQVPTENRVGFRADGRIEWGGLTDQVIGQWQPGQEATYTVRVEIDFPNETADVWINGELLGEGLPAFPRVIPASSIYGAEIPLNKWGFGVENFSGPGPGRLFIDDICLGEYSTAIEADVRIKPETLNVKSGGRFVTAYIELPEGYDVGDIDVETVYLSVGDGDSVPAEFSSAKVGDHHGVPTLRVRFDREAVKSLLEPADGVEFAVGGELTDGTRFLGTDTIRVVAPGKKK